MNRKTVAVGETIDRVPREETELTVRLVAHYMDIREGIGSHKSPAEYGSFPFDPYSHTPTMAGVQQPGMTGQVKEDIISRWFELGISVRDGQLWFGPRFICSDDFENGELRFTYCGTEVIYRLKYKLPKHGWYVTNTPPVAYSAEDSAHVFARDGKVKQIIVELCKK